VFPLWLGVVQPKSFPRGSQGDFSFPAKAFPLRPWLWKSRFHSSPSHARHFLARTVGWAVEGTVRRSVKRTVVGKMPLSHPPRYLALGSCYLAHPPRYPA